MVKYGFNRDTILFNNLYQKDSLLSTIFCKNFSDANISVLKIELGCGCTKTKLIDSIIKPGDSVAIFIKYLPSLNKDSGQVIKYITVRTNSSPTFLNLVIKGNVVK